MTRYITIRSRCLERLHTLYADLEEISKNSETLLVRLIGLRYRWAIHQMQTNTDYFFEIAFIPSVRDDILGEINLSRIEEFVRDYSDDKK